MQQGLARDADVSSENPEVVRRGAELLQESLRITHEIGGTVLTGALYSPFGKAEAPLTSRGRDNVVAVLRELAAEAAPLGVTLGLEVCNRYEVNVVNTAHDALVLADDIGSDNVMIHLDSYHMNIEEKDRGYLGSGHLNFPAFFDALAEIDGLSNDLAIWRNLWDDGFDLAVRAREFMADGLTAGRAARP